MGRSFSFIVSKEQQEPIVKIISRNGGWIVSERPLENGIQFKVRKTLEPQD